MDLDTAYEAPTASTSSAAIQQQAREGEDRPAVETSRSTASNASSGVLLFPFEAEGDLCQSWSAAVRDVRPEIQLS